MSQKVHKTVGGMLRSKKNWTKNTMHKITNNGTHKYCLLGAIGVIYDIHGASPWTPQGSKAKRIVRAASQAIKKLYPTVSKSVIGFNDHKETTFTMVRNVIREAKI